MVSELSHGESDDPVQISVATSTILKARNRSFKKKHRVLKKVSVAAMDSWRSWISTSKQESEGVRSNFIDEEKSSIVFGSIGDSSFSFPKPIEPEDDGSLQFRFLVQ
jgi:hypothetical protein